MYVYVGLKGVTATDTVSLIRVTLPSQEFNKFETLPEPAIFEYGAIKKLAATLGRKEVIEMPEGLPAKTTGTFVVPNYEMTIPKPDDQTASIVVDANRLVELLKAAIEVTEHNKNLVSLRFYKDFIRIDAHRDIGGQEFLGLMMGTNYSGDGIPGDAKNPTHKSAPETVDDGHFKLPVFEGRKFREVEGD